MMMTNHHRTGDTTTTTSSTNPVLYPVPAVATPPQPQSTINNSSQQQLTLSTASSCSSCPLCSLCRALGLLSHPTQQQEQEQELRDSGLAKWFTVCLAVLLLGSALILLIQYSRYSTTWYLCGNMFLASFALVVLRRLNSNSPTDRSKAQLYETLITVFAAVLSWKSLEDAFKGYNYGMRYAFGYPSRLFIVWQLMTVVTSWLYVRRLYRKRRQQQQQACGEESTTVAPAPTTAVQQPQQPQQQQSQQRPELQPVNSSTAPSSFNNFNSSITEQQQAQWQPWSREPPQLQSWATALSQQQQQPQPPVQQLPQATAMHHPPSSYKLFIPPYTIRPQAPGPQPQQQQQPQELGQQ